MIVLSIVTALALERAAVAIHDAAAARDSRARIEAEIARDAAELRRCEQSNAVDVKAATGVLKLLVAALKQGRVGQAALEPIFKPAYEHFNIAAPSWQHDAWDTAIADQSASHMASADLRRYAEIYTTAREIDATTQLLLGGEWLTRMATLRLDEALGTLDGRALADGLARFLLAVGQIDRMQQDLQTLIATGHNPEDDNARPDPMGGPAAKPAGDQK
jgi:hypothetical protein